MTDSPETVRGQLQALRQFFLFRYSEEARKRYMVFHSVFPFVQGTRLDLVQVNGGARVHFIYRQGAGGEHLVVVHDLMLDVGDAVEDQERRLVLRSLDMEGSLAHFVLRPPYTERFDLVEEEAVAAVSRHARLRPVLDN